jgi:MoaA/NifB/PqqE/SkfB family radical SAM enzyme
MTTDVVQSRSRTALAGGEPAADRVTVQPLLHVDPDRLYNPVSDLTLRPGDGDFELLRGLAGGELAVEELAAADRERLLAASWLLAPGVDPSRQYLLKYVSLEAHTVCNQACYFCPVSVDPREDYFMPTETYERIVGELAAWRDTIEAVFMISYNEPTLDKRFVEQVRTIKQAGLPPAVLTNGSGLTPDRVDRLVEMGGLRFLSINLSTADRERYRATRGGDHLKVVLRNLEHARDLPVAETMDIVVLGTGDQAHRDDFAELAAMFAGSRFNVKSFEVMDRAGYLQIGASVAKDGKSLCGCDNMGPRPIQHLHITPRGKCVLCCEDYDENYVVGDLHEQSVEEVLTGPAMALMRRWVYGLEEAPADFICNRCIFSRRR